MTLTLLVMQKKVIVKKVKVYKVISGNGEGTNEDNSNSNDGGDQSKSQEDSSS